MAFVYELTVKDNGTATLKKIGKEAENLEDKFKKTNSAIDRMNIVMANLAVQGINKGVSILKDFGKEMVASYDSAAKLSQNIGVTAESVLGLRHAAELSGVGAEAMDRNMEKLSKAMFEAASGNKSAGESFKQLGIAVTNSDGSLKKSDAVLMEMADRFKTLPSGAEKAAVAMNIFGKSGASMVTMLKDGSAGLKAMVDEGAGAAGNVKGISEAMEKLNDAGVKAKAALMGLLAGIVDSPAFKAMISGIESVSDALIKWRVESQKEAEAEKTATYAMLERNEAMLEYLKIVDREYDTDKVKSKGKEISDGEAKIRLQAQIMDLKEKLKLDDEELRLIKLKATAEAYTKKSNIEEGLSDDDMAKYDLVIAKIAELEEKKAEAAKNAAGIPVLPKDDSATKAYAAETKRLQDWLKKYQDSKRIEQQIAKDNYIEQNKNLEELAKRDKAVAANLAEYKKQVATDYTDKLKEIDDKANEERIKAAEATMTKEWEFRRISAKKYNDIAQIEIEQITFRYKKEIELAEGAGKDIALIKQAEAAELAAINEKSLEAQRQREDTMRSYRETAAQSDAERIRIQQEGIEARYDAELAKAQYTADERIA